MRKQREMKGLWAVKIKIKIMCEISVGWRKNTNWQK